jgi:hypothetical protein
MDADPTVAGSIRRMARLLKVLAPLTVLIVVLAFILPGRIFRAREQAADNRDRLRRQVVLAQLDAANQPTAFPAMPPNEVLPAPKPKAAPAPPPPAVPPAPRPLPLPPAASPPTATGNPRPAPVATVVVNPPGTFVLPAAPAAPVPPNPLPPVPQSPVSPPQPPATNRAATNVTVTNVVLNPPDTRTNQNASTKTATNQPPRQAQTRDQEQKKAQPQANAVPTGPNYLLPPPRDGVIRLSFP